MRCRAVDRDRSLVVALLAVAQGRWCVRAGGSGSCPTSGLRTCSTTAAPVVRGRRRRCRCRSAAWCAGSVELDDLDGRRVLGREPVTDADRRGAVAVVESGVRDLSPRGRRGGRRASRSRTATWSTCCRERRSRCSGSTTSTCGRCSTRSPSTSRCGNCGGRCCTVGTLVVVDSRRPRSPDALPARWLRGTGRDGAQPDAVGVLPLDRRGPWRRLAGESALRYVIFGGEALEPGRLAGVVRRVTATRAAAGQHVRDHRDDRARHRIGR